MTTREFIEKALLGNYIVTSPLGLFMILNDYDGTISDETISKNIHRIILDPKAWKAVAKAEKWQKEVVNTFIPLNPIKSKGWFNLLHSKGAHSPFEEMVRMVAYLDQGKSIEQFLETL